MFKQIIFPILLVVCLPLLLKIMVRLRLGPTLVYILLANTVLLQWASEHIRLSNGILFAMLALTVLSWGVTLYLKVRSLADMSGRCYDNLR